MCRHFAECAVITCAASGKGYAKQAMLQLPAFVANYFPWCDEIVLAVNHRNQRAKNLYRSSGFIDKGRRRIGPIGEQHILHHFCESA